MSAVDRTTEQDAPSSGLDRRAALKKLAVGGAVAWTAPTLLSSRAHAQDAGVCTPKCFPFPDVLFDGTSSLYCTRNGNKWVQIDYAIGASTCPCGNEGRDLELVLVQITSGNASFKFNTPTSENTGFLVIGGPGNGSLSNGTYGVSARFRTTCIDRDGTPITRFCNAPFVFTFSPSNGPCSQGENVGVVNPLPTICDDPICGLPAPT